jgi:signal transduction histidine kinase
MTKSATERKQEKEEQIKVRILANNIQESIDPVIILSLEGKNIVEKSQYHLLGVKEEELLDRHVLEFPGIKNRRLGEFDEFGLYSKEAKEIDKINPLDVTIVPLDGQEIPVGVMEGMLKDDEGNPVYIIALFRNKPQYKNIEQILEERTNKIKKMQKKLLQKEKLAMIGQLVVAIGHELRNPLGVINNSFYSLDKMLKDENARIRKHLDIIFRNIDYANRIVADLLDFSSTRRNSIVMANINEIIRDAVRNLYIPTDVSIQTEYGEAIAESSLDPDQMRRVFSNIIINAIGSMPNGGKMKISTKMEDSLIFIQINDTGKGIPEENIQKIFEPFFTTRKKGTGLGLTIVKSIVEMHGGTVAVTSIAGEGTTFTIRLPLKNPNTIETNNLS